MERMTTGEKLIWAAIYAQEITRKSPKRSCGEASEIATCEIRNLRKNRRAIESGYDADTAQSLKEMGIWYETR